MNEPGNNLLSVIIPTKNRPHLLQRAMASVALQNYKGFEVCIADNNTDNEIIDQVKQTVNNFANKYPHINWIYIHSNKQFASGARNDGMAATKGRYILFLDDDDELLENSITIRVNEMVANSRLVLLYCAAYSKIYPYPVKMYRYYHYNKQLHTEKLMMMSCSSIVINREVCEKNDLYFDEDQSRMDDYDLCRRIIELNLEVKSIPQPLVLINLHPDTRISSHQLINYDFKDVLVKKWGKSAAEEVYSYAEGVYLWRKCFGVEEHTLTEIITSLKNDFNREPTLSFRLKFFLISISAKLYLGLYHIAIIFSQSRKNRQANNYR